MTILLNLQLVSVLREDLQLVSGANRPQGSTEIKLIEYDLSYH